MTTCYAFDLDGTLTSIELLPRIARELGVEREIAYLTRLTMDGVLGFEDSMRLRCACLRAAPLESVRAIVADAPVDPLLAEFIYERRDSCAIVTGNLDVWIAPLVERFGCAVYSSRARTSGGVLEGVESVLHKGDAVLALRERFDRVVAVGDGVNDIPMFEVADLGIACGFVHPPAPRLVQAADFVVYRGDALCRLLKVL
jgi:phosphoserine phosphatase